MPTHPFLRWLPGFAGVLALALCSGCGARGEAQDGEGGGPSVRLLWSTEVRESDSLYLGRPTELALDPQDGSFYVSDRFHGRVVRIRRDGSIVAAYGRKGHGPAEFVDVGPPFVWRGKLYVADVPEGRVSVFNRQSGAFERRYRVDGILTRAVVTPRGVLLGLQDGVLQLGAARWVPETERIERFAAFPDAYRRSAPLAGIFTGVSVDYWADTSAVAYQGSDRVVLFTDAGAAVDTIVIPAARRRGVPDDLVERFERIEFPEMFQSASFLFDLKRLRDGRLALVHYDQQIENRAITSVPYLSVSSADRRAWCLDAVLPLSRDAQPQTVFRGDTLFALDQRAQGESAVTRIQAFAIDTSECTWTEPGRAE